MGGKQTTGTAPSSTGSRQLRTMLALVVVLAAVVAVVLLVPRLFQEETDEVETVETVLLLDVDADEVTSLSWTGEDGTAVSLELVDGTWCDASDPDAALDQDLVASMVEAVAAVVVERTVDADSVTDEMGASDPQVQATLGLSDGTQVELAVGVSTADGSGNYVWVDDDGTAYIVDGTLAGVFAVTVADLYEMEEGPGAATSEVTSLTIEHDGTTLVLRYYPDGSDASYSDSYTWFSDDGSGEQAADTSAAQVLVNLVNNVSWTSCADATYDSSDSSDYGFDDPTLVVTLAYTVEDEGDEDEGADDEDEGESEGEDDEDEDEGESEAVEQTFVLVVGAQAESGDYYAQPQGSDRVYTLSASTVERLLDATSAGLAPDDVLLMDWDTVDSIDVTYDGQTHTVAIVRTVETDDDGNETEETSYTVDGTEVLARTVENLLDALDALDAEGEAVEEPASTEAEITFTFYRSTETYSEMTLSLIPYDNSFYLVSFDGQERLLVNKNDVADLIDLYESLCEAL